MRKVLFGVFTYLEFAVAVLVFLPILAAVAAFGGLRRRGRWMRRFGRVTGACTPLWRFSVEGAAPRDIGEAPYVVVGNHVSTADPFLLSWLPWDMRWVGKEELFRLPVLGWLLRCAGDIPLRRGDRTSVEAMFRACRQTLDGGLSVMLFPEGTRSRDGNLQPFKDGAFQLAIEAQVPVLPLVLHGTHACRPKGSLWFGEARAVVRVLEPVPTKGLGPADVGRLREQVRERIEAELAKAPETPCPARAARILVPAPTQRAS